MESASAIQMKSREHSQRYERVVNLKTRERFICSPSFHNCAASAAFRREPHKLVTIADAPQRDEQGAGINRTRIDADAFEGGFEYAREGCSGRSNDFCRAQAALIRRDRRRHSLILQSQITLIERETA